MSQRASTQASAIAEPPLVSVIMPVRNEAGHIEPCLRAVAAQDYPMARLEVLIADGMSDDGTRARITEFARTDARVRLIDNPNRIVPTGLNAALRAARGEIIIRMDAHTEYAPDYVRQCVRVLGETGADNVGGAWVATGRSWLQKAIALAFHSRFASGGAGSHSVAYEGEVDSVYLGCWRKTTLERIGGFDDELVRNQDDELCLRLSRAGGKLWQSTAIKSTYFPRASVSALFRQYAQYGYWKVRVIQKHKLPASIRHLVPGGFVGSLILLALASIFSAWARWALVVLLGTYTLANLVATISTCARSAATMSFLPVMPLVFIAYHVGYGYGFLRGLIDFVVLRSGGNKKFSRLTRGQSSAAP
ncbi:MAG: glycosyltransferase family 2 protein [Verrucomicrobia bacterium]|nr:glycosyltransferase family 2 protein [Verrucomicrobiota bacterium]